MGVILHIRPRPTGRRNLRRECRASHSAVTPVTA